VPTPFVRLDRLVARPPSRQRRMAAASSHRRAAISGRASLYVPAVPLPGRSGPIPRTVLAPALRLDDGAVVWSDQIYPADRHGFDFNSAPGDSRPHPRRREQVTASMPGTGSRDGTSGTGVDAVATEERGVAGPTNGPKACSRCDRRLPCLRAVERRVPQRTVSPRLLWPSTGRSSGGAAAQLLVRRPSPAGTASLQPARTATFRALETATGRSSRRFRWARRARAPRRGRRTTRSRRRRRALPAGHLLVCVGSARVAGSR
jgi:hypothetical protein